MALSAWDLPLPILKGRPKEPSLPPPRLQPEPQLWSLFGNPSSKRKKEDSNTLLDPTTYLVYAHDATVKNYGAEWAENGRYYPQQWAEKYTNNEAHKQWVQKHASNEAQNKWQQENKWIEKQHASVKQWSEKVENMQEGVKRQAAAREQLEQQFDRLASVMDETRSYKRTAKEGADSFKEHLEAYNAELKRPISRDIQNTATGATKSMVIKVSPRHHAGDLAPLSDEAMARFEADMQIQREQREQWQKQKYHDQRCSKNRMQLALLERPPQIPKPSTKKIQRLVSNKVARQVKSHGIHVSWDSNLIVQPQGITGGAVGGFFGLLPAGMPPPRQSQ